MDNNINKVKIFKFIIFILFACIVIYNVIHLFPIIQDITTPSGRVLFKEKITNSGVWGFLMLFLLQLAQIFLAILPGEPLEILAGMCYGAVWGTIFILVTVFITTMIIVFLVRTFGKKVIYEFFNEKKISRFEKNKFFSNHKNIEIILFILFFIPGTPKDLFTYVGATLSIKSIHFILISTFARIPSIISSTLVGSNIINGDFKSIFLIYVITFLLSLISFFTINIFDKNKKLKMYF